MSKIELDSLLLTAIDKYGWNGIFESLERICNFKANSGKGVDDARDVAFKKVAAIIKDAGEKVSDYLS